MVMSLKEQVVDVVRTHRLWLHQKCKITNEALYAEIATHLFVMVARLGLIPKTGSHVSPILAVENGRERLTNFVVNRYFLTAVMDWALRRGTCNNAIVKQFQQCHEGLIRSAWSRIKKEIPTPFHVDQARGNSLEIMFGSVEEFFPFVQRGILKPLNNYKTPKKSRNKDYEPVTYREFYSVELDRTFFAKESAVSEWGQDSDWRMISNHTAGFPVMGKTRGFCLPRLACTMAAGRLVELDLGKRPDHEDELIGESLDSLLSRPNHRDYDEFPWEAFIQYVENSTWEKVIRTELDNPDRRNSEKASVCGLSKDQYKHAKTTAFAAANFWYNSVGVNLD
jgi:hypothetical protein